MKKIISALIVISISLSSFGKVYMNKEFALFDFNIEINETLMQKFVDRYGPIISKVPNAEGVMKKLKDNFYYAFKEFMVNEKEIIILPINTYGDKITYDMVGYPDTKLKKVVRVGDAHYYFKLDIEIIDFLEEEKDFLDEYLKDVEDPLEYIMPIFKMTMSIYDRNGMLPIDKFESEIKAEELVKLENVFMNGILNSQTKYNKNELMYMLTKASEEIASNIKR